MRKEVILKLFLLTFVAGILACSASSWGSGYLISSHSVRSFGLASAYVANTDSVDSAYFNPANMVWLNEAAKVDVGATYIKRPGITFDGTVYGIPAPAESKDEKEVLPFLHFVSPKYGKWRFGASILEPAGIAQRWDAVFQEATAEESMLRVIMINPSVAYMINSRISLAGGLRIVYADAELKAQLPPGFDQMLSQGYSQDVEGDAWEVGFNLAVTANLTDSLRISTTFRSEINIDIEGSGSGYTTNPLTGQVYTFDNVSGRTSIPLPAMLSLAISKTIGKATLEFVYERIFWSAFNDLDLNFDDPIVELTLGGSRPRDWDDSSNFRFGASYLHSDNLKLMLGISYEKTPVPERTLSFDLPDSDLLWLAAGVSYSIKPNIEIGFAYSYGHYMDRTIDASDYNVNGIVGEFSDSLFHSLTASFSYRF